MYCYRRWSHKLRAKNGEMGRSTVGRGDDGQGDGYHCDLCDEGFGGRGM